MQRFGFRVDADIANHITTSLTSISWFFLLAVTAPVQLMLPLQNHVLSCLQNPVKVRIVRTYGAVLTVLSDTTIVITVTGSMTNFS